MNDNLYEILGLDRTATAEQVKKAYRRKALETHPDKLPAGASPEDRTKAEEEFRLVNNAYEVLRSPENRQLYDTHGVWPPPQGRSAPGPSAFPFGGPPSHTNGWPFGNDPFFGGGGRRQAPPMFDFTDPFVLFDTIFRESMRGHSHWNHPGEHAAHHHHNHNHNHSRDREYDYYPYEHQDPHHRQHHDHHSHYHRPGRHYTSERASRARDTFDDDFGPGMNDPFFGFAGGSNSFFGNSMPGFGATPFGGFGFPFGGGPMPGMHNSASTTFSSSSMSSGGGGGGGRWVSESHVTNIINGQKTSEWKRTDSDGNRHVTKTFPDGRETYTINGVTQPPVGQRIEDQRQAENLVEASAAPIPSTAPPPYPTRAASRVSNSDPPFIPPENDVNPIDAPRNRRESTGKNRSWWGFW